MKLDGKIALVTGAARGIGRGCAIELARAGADVAVNDLKRTPAAEQIVAEIEALGRRGVLVEGDAFDHDACGVIVARAVEAFGRLDILVSNPALIRREEFLKLSITTFEQVLKATLTGGFSMSQHAARHMVARAGGGKIVLISSVHARKAFVRCAAYDAAKAGLSHMARTIAAELAPQRINVNVIEPGWIDTPGEHESFSDEFLREATSRLPWGRMGRPEEIGKVAVFLASSDADYITGTEILVDGGLMLREDLP